MDPPDGRICCGPEEAQKRVRNTKIWAIWERKRQRGKDDYFDLDGVLVYTDKFHYLAWKKMADRIGVPFDETINNRLRGVSRMDSLEIILERSTRKYTTEEKKIWRKKKRLL